jgi:hypothetical protein
MGIRWLQVVTANCGKLLERPLTLQIKMTKWRWISHKLRNGDECVKSKKWIGICREPEGEEDKQTWKRTILEEAGKFGKTWGGQQSDVVWAIVTLTGTGMA